MDLKTKEFSDYLKNVRKNRKEFKPDSGAPLSLEHVRTPYRMIVEDKYPSCENVIVLHNTEKMLVLTDIKPAKTKSTITQNIRPVKTGRKRKYVGLYGGRHNEPRLALKITFTCHRYESEAVRKLADVLIKQYEQMCMMGTK